MPVLTFDWGDVLVALHLLGATVWVGGQLVLAGLVPVLRRAAPSRTATRRTGAPSR